MSSDAAIPEGSVRFHHISKRYPVSKRSGAWRHAIPGPVGTPEPRGRIAVDQVDLTLEPGETLGIIGPNGAGKSTLLKLLAGVANPTSGSVEHGGQLGSMIELGLGFHPDLTGWENLQVGAVLLGLSATQLQERAEEIIAFAQLEDAMNTPIKHFSTGMAARLGFSLATHVDAKVLAVDEVLAVGDREFQERCLARIASLVDDGCTVLFVSHELPLVNLVCERVVRLEEGRVVDDGPASEVIEAYLGRAASTIDPGVPPARITRLGLVEQRIDPSERLAIDLEVEVTEPATSPPSLLASLSMPSIRPGLTIAESLAPLPVDWTRPGTHHLIGRTSVLPLAGGELRLTAALRAGVRRTLSSDDVDFAINGSNRIVKPMYVLQPHAQLCPVEPPDDGVPTVRTTNASNVVARLRGVTKRFRSGTHRAVLRPALPGRLGRNRPGDRLALDGVDLDIRSGEALGVIGPNGAGKSTLLKAISGLYELDDGTIDVTGQVVSVHELGVGFHGDLTGRENLRVSAALSGLSASGLEERLDAILRAAGLGEAIDLPVKRYSTGMRARLGFALITHVPSRILLIDELLAVGDEAFRTSARRRIRELVDEGVAVVFVSHNLPLVAEVCDRVIRLEAGVLVEDGDASDVLEHFGGLGWSAGSAIGTGPVRLHDLSIRDIDHRSKAGIEFTCLLEISEAAPHVRLEFSLRDHEIEDRSQPRTPEAVERLTGALAVLFDQGDLPGPGWYELTGTTGPILCDGRLDLTLSAVDARDGEALAEAWKLARFGDGRASTVIDFDVEWEAVSTPSRSASRIS